MLKKVNWPGAGAVETSFAARAHSASTAVVEKGIAPVGIVEMVVLMFQDEQILLWWKPKRLQQMGSNIYHLKPLGNPPRS